MLVIHFSNQSAHCIFGGLGINGPWTYEDRDDCRNYDDGISRVKHEWFPELTHGQMIWQTDHGDMFWEHVPCTPEEIMGSLEYLFSPSYTDDSGVTHTWTQNIYTVSELVVLSVQQQIRNGTLCDKDVKIILYRSDTPEWRSGKHMQLNKEGEFVDDWPGGFTLLNTFARS
jgi:hypothetical protein